MASPSLITFYHINSTADNVASLVTPSFTPADGEVIIVKVASENFDKPSVASAAGGALTFTSHVSISQANQGTVRIYGATVGTSPGSMTVTVTFTGNNGFHSMAVERWASAQLAGSPAVVSTIATGAPSVTITTVADGSAVSWVDSDWNASPPGTPTYRSGAIQEGIHDISPDNYVAYFAYQATTTAGLQTVGLTNPVGQNASIGGIEIQGGGDVVPSVTTQAVTNITGATATGNGTVLSDGGDTITERGVCWSTSLNPTTSDSKAVAAGTTGVFSASITGLTNGTLYHVRAYAINAVGTSYGSDVPFTPYLVSVGWLSA